MAHATASWFARLAAGWLILASQLALVATAQSAAKTSEEIAAPAPDEASLPRAPLPGPVGLVTRLPAVTEQGQPPAIRPALPAETDEALPINLATALYLSSARPLVIALAQASVENAAARLQGANVLWLPNLNVGTDYYRHDGLDQSTDGTIIRDDKYALAAGGGATMYFGVTDAIFQPLAARRELAARESDLQAARNKALMYVALAYFDVQQARGTLAGARDAVAKAEALVKKTTGLAAGLVPEMEVNRARALWFDLAQQEATARANWRIASARLTRVLRLSPGALVMPLEPPHLQVTLISPSLPVCDLIPVGLASRPELASQQAVVQAATDLVRQERLRPFIPNVLVDGGNGPGGGFNGGLFGGGPDGGPQLYGGRFDVEMGVVWTLSNLGAGNRSLIRQRTADEMRASIGLADVQDEVAEEVTQAHAQLEATATQVDQAANSVKEATITFDGTLRGLGETRGGGELLILVSRPQEAVAALQQLSRAYDNYYAAVNGYNRAQFQLFWALGCPARTLICDHPLGEVDPLDVPPRNANQGG